MSRFLVTGGAGFIGSHIVELLLQKGHEVCVFDNFSSGKEENLSFADNKIKIIKADVRDSRSLAQATKGMDYIVHEAALPSVSKSVEAPVTSTEINLMGTLNVLAAAKENRVKRVFFASSSAVYGEEETLPKTENSSCVPVSPYGIQKYTCELYCKVFTRYHNLETVCLRYFNVFGPKQNPDSEYAAVIPIFLRKMLRGQAPVIFGDGSQTRDFVFVKDVARATISALMAPDVSGKVFNIASGTKITINQLVAALNKILKSNLKPIYTELRSGDIKHSYADVSLARESFGYQPVAEFEKGLAETASYLKKML
ncbi:MAG: SDR family oxidoreductase [Planctomycetota bacterium]